MNYIRSSRIDCFCMRACDRGISEINVGCEKVLLDKPTYVKSFFLLAVENIMYYWHQS